MRALHRPAGLTLAFWLTALLGAVNTPARADVADGYPGWPGWNASARVAFGPDCGAAPPGYSQPNVDWATINYGSAFASLAGGSIGGVHLLAGSSCILNYSANASAFGDFGVTQVYASTSKIDRQASAVAYGADKFTFMPKAGQTGSGTATFHLTLTGSVVIAASGTSSATAVSLSFFMRQIDIATNIYTDLFAWQMQFPTALTNTTLGVLHFDPVVSFKYNQPIYVFSNLGATAGQIGNPFVAGTIADLSNSARLNWIEAGPDVDVVSGSGTAYPLSNVPEPGTAWLWLDGFGLAALARRRTRRQGAEGR